MATISETVMAAFACGVFYLLLCSFVDAANKDKEEGGGKGERAISYSSL